MKRFYQAIVLAAGESSGTKPENKIVLPYSNEIVLTHICRNVLASKIDSLEVVIGHQANFVRRELNKFDFQYVINTSYSLGEMSSLQTSVSRLKNNDLFVLFLADMPLINTVLINALLNKFEACEIDTDDFIFRPVFKSIGGYPIIFSAALKDKILEYANTESVENFIDALDCEKHYWNIGNNAFYDDITTKVDYYKMRK